MSTRTPKPKFVLHLEAQHRHNDANGMRRLRGALKWLLRTWGLRCVKLDFPNATPAHQDARSDAQKTPAEAAVNDHANAAQERPNDFPQGAKSC